MPDLDKSTDQLILEINRLREKVEKLEEEALLSHRANSDNSSLLLLDVLKGTSESILIVVNGIIRFANTAFSLLTGYSFDEMQTIHDIWLLVHPDDRPGMESFLDDRFLNSGPAKRFEFRLFCKDSSLKWVEMNSSLISWEGNKGLLCFLTDVTLRKNMERDLKQKTRELTERVKEVSCLYHISSLVQTPDLPLKQVLKLMVELIPPAWQYPEITCARITYEGDEFKTANYAECVALQSEPVLIDGKTLGLVEVCYLEARPDCDSGPFLKEEQHLIKLISEIVSDFILRKRSEEALKILGRASDTSINGMRLVAPDGSVFYSNEASRQMWGYESIDEMIGLQVYELWKDRDELDEALKQLHETGHFSGKLTALKKDGTTFDALVSINKVVDNAGNLLGLVASHTDITAQKQAEETIRDRQTRFEAITSSVFDAIILIDDCGLITFWNKAAEKIFGYDCSEALGKNLHKLLAPPEYHQAHLKAFSEFARTGNGEAVGKITELTAVRKGGERFPIELSLSGFQMNGRWNASGIVRDVSERRKGEEDLKRSEQRFRQVADSADEWIWEVDQFGMYTYSSAAVEKILGYSTDDLVGKKFFYDLFLPEEAETLKEMAFREFAQCRSFRGFINRNIRKNGEIAVIESSGVAILDPDGKMVGYRGVDKDITERFRAEEDYRRLFTAIEYTAGSVVVTNAQGTIEYVNPAFEKITGYESEEIIGKNPRILKSGKHDPAFYRNLWDTISRGDVWSGVLINRKKDGSLIHEEGTISPVKDSEGNIINYVKVTRDVTREVDLQKQLIQSQKMEAIGTLAGGIAHDFNNILFAITGNTELAIQALPEDSRLRSNLERVLNAANRATDMVRQILAFSRQDKPQRQPLDITPIIKEGIKFLRASIPANIEINQSIQSNLPKIDGDPTQIHQVLINICINASHAMKGKNGLLTISLRSIQLDHDLAVKMPSVAPGDYVNLTISDTGHGMSQEIIDHIFEPYFTTKGKGEGTGFGLSIVHSIIQNHGGFVTVQSEKGKGATFSVYLPAIEQAPQTDAESQKTVAITGGTESILVVDDEAILVDVAKSIFESLGYKAVGVTDPLVALEMVMKNPNEFDLLFTDLSMPKMPGDELAEKIRAIRKDIPVIICTGLSQSLTPQKLQEVGIRAVIEKPLLKKDMAKIVRTVLDSGN